MSSLTDIDKRYFEKILNMETGYVLNLSNCSFGQFFACHKINIHDQKYQTLGTSKANKMRAFWEQESDRIVAKVLSEMLDLYEANCELTPLEPNSKVLKKCRDIISKLAGKQTTSTAIGEDSFLEQEFTIPNIDKLPVEAQVASIIYARLQEAQVALDAGAYLSVIFLCGSVLEGMLLGVAQRKPEKFNGSPTSPKRKGKVKPLNEWNLAQLIDTACDIQLLEPDVKKFSHGLRDFRNYIHPYEQMTSGFTPDEHTAKICFQVLKAALASLAGER
ncbi:MAG: hypothetical protein OXI72_05645 [Gemmatimonadota bacterium]|nr:hypothetical protein [Gemmatimonadota bacterium]